MLADGKSIKIYMMPLEYPCGPQSSCCGPIGQSEGEIQELKSAIEKEFNLNVEIVNIRDGVDMTESQVIKLLNTFGAMALPLIALDGDVVSVGNPFPQEAVQAIKQKLAE